MNAQGVMGALDRIGRRILTTIGRGRLTAGDDTGNVQLLQVQLGANEVRDNTPRLAEFGFTSNPPIGADLVVLFVGGDRSNGVIIASGDISTRLKNLRPGESALYDSIGKHVYLKADQIEVNANGQPVNIINATTVTIDASSDVTVNCGGNLVANATGSATITAGADATISATGAVAINGSAGVSITTDGDAVCTINGSLSATATGSVTLSASSISLN